MKLTAVLPTYNEAENLPLMIEAVLALKLPVEFSILIVDDNSPDGTGEIADRLAAAHPDCIEVMHRAGKLGLGTAYVQGFRHVLQRGADIALQMDSDFSHDPKYLPQMVDTMLTCDCDLVIGSRYVKGGSVDETWSIFRKLLSWWANSIYVNLILGTKVKDSTGGFRLWRRCVLEGMDWNRIRSNGYVFQVETIYVAEKLGYSDAEVPIYFADRKRGRSKMSLKIQLEAALRVWQVWWRHRHLTPADRVPGSECAGEPAAG